MKRSILALASVALSMAGCASNPPSSKYAPVDAATAQALQGHDVQLLVKPTPSFVHMTTGDQATMTVGMLFGAVGGVVAAATAIKHSQSAGQALVVENGIPDPTALLSEKVRELLATKYGSAIGSSGYAVTVATDHWALAKGAVVFNASVSVTRGETAGSKPLALGQCRYRSSNGANASTEDELLANHAEKLKAELGTALDRCVEEFRQKLFP
ncbi:hypothetical protein [Dokdonella sp.]|uniref:hypothetical protein n=1 Tax=Dokdonella sp. TaxID=2291710 RepID=UPI003783C603